MDLTRTSLLLISGNNNWKEEGPFCLHSQQCPQPDDMSDIKCPIFPGYTKRLHWNFTDPLALEGTHVEKLQRAREIRDQIKERIIDWLKDIS